MNCADEKWDNRYLDLAQHIGEKWSKDPSRKVGAVIVGDHGQILSQGYNGFPRKLHDDEDRLNDRETKYKYVVHAEMNCIYNAALNGNSLVGSTLYVYGLPICHECAKGVIQVGISRVVQPIYSLDNLMQDKWKSSRELALDMFHEAGIVLDEIAFNRYSAS